MKGKWRAYGRTITHKTMGRQHFFKGNKLCYAICGHFEEFGTIEVPADRSDIKKCNRCLKKLDAEE